MEALLNIAGARGGAGGGFLGAHDAERLIESLRDFEVDDVGSARWTEQRESLERLNVQAHHNAVTHSDEFVKEFLVSHDKVKTLVRELLVAEVWKEKVYPRFDEDAIGAGVVATEVYLAHHHEATLCNLLEIAFFHKDACEAAGDDALLELTDYCVRKLVYLVGEGEAPGSSAAADVAASVAALDDDAHDFAMAASERRLGDAWVIAQRRSGLIVGVAVPLVILLRWPGAALAVIRGAAPLVTAALGVAARLFVQNPRLVPVFTGLIRQFGGRYWTAAVNRARAKLQKTMDHSRPGAVAPKAARAKVVLKEQT